MADFVIDSIDEVLNIVRCVSIDHTRLVRGAEDIARAAKGQTGELDSSLSCLHYGRRPIDANLSGVRAACVKKNIRAQQFALALINPRPFASICGRICARIAG